MCAIFSNIETLFLVSANIVDERTENELIALLMSNNINNNIRHDHVKSQIISYTLYISSND